MDSQERIQRLQLLEQNMQGLLQQKQQFQTQLFEMETAMKELGSSTDAYRIIGNIMIKSERSVIEKDLLEKKEMLNLRMQTIEKQEAQIKDKADTLRKEILAGMKEK